MSAGPVVGIVGGGQLARMLAEAATPMGIHVRVLAAPGDEGASEVVPDVQVGSPTDPDALASFARTVDVVTFDHENVDHKTLAELESSGVAVRPGVATLAFSDKAHQRREFAAAGLPVPAFAVIDPLSDPLLAAERAAAFHAAHADGEGLVVAKASRGGYDGRGVWIVDADGLAELIDGYDGAPLVLEPKLSLIREVAVLVARRPSGETSTRPLLETVQVDGMCDEVFLPAPVDDDLRAEASVVAEKVAEVTGAVGVMAIELFVVDGPAGSPQLLINEIAPRVHNSGHLTIEGSATSQFEQHLRAVLDWPLGPTGSTSPVSVMVNVVGGPDADPRDRQADALALVPEAHLHLYGKLARPARKIGHVTVCGDDLERSRRRANLAAEVIAGTADTPSAGTLEEP